jgi:hypothetical protein
MKLLIPSLPLFAELYRHLTDSPFPPYFPYTDACGLLKNKLYEYIDHAFASHFTHKR